MKKNLVTSSRAKKFWHLLCHFYAPRLDLHVTSFEKSEWIWLEIMNTKWEFKSYACMFAVAATVAVPVMVVRLQKKWNNITLFFKWKRQRKKGSLRTHAEKNKVGKCQGLSYLRSLRSRLNLTLMVIAMMMVMLIVAVLVVVSNGIFPVIYITACNNAMKSSV